MKVFIILALLVTANAQASGIYDPDIAVIKERFGAYIAQSEKNIAALTKLVGAYDRVNDAMNRVAEVKKSLTLTRCPRDTKEKLLNCLSTQRALIAILDLYVRTGADIMPKAIADAKEAGNILNQDVSAHLAKFKKIDQGFKTWNTKTIPALKVNAEHDREVLASMYGESFKVDYQATALLEESRHEAALLAEEITQAGVRLRQRGMVWLGDHRLAHAKLTAASMVWLENQIPAMWTALEPAIQKEAKIKELTTKVLAALSEQKSLLSAEIAKRTEPAERLSGIELLKSRVRQAKLSDSNRKAFDGLFKEMTALATDSHKSDFTDVLLERGYTWLEAMSQ